MSIKKQLSAYYDKQGLTGKHRRKAMQYDMKAARHNAKVFWGHSRELFYLMSSFIFMETPEGHEYWACREGIR